MVTLAGTLTVGLWLSRSAIIYCYILQKRSMSRVQASIRVTPSFGGRRSFRLLISGSLDAVTSNQDVQGRAWMRQEKKDKANTGTETGP